MAEKKYRATESFVAAVNGSEVIVRKGHTVVGENDPLRVGREHLFAEESDD